MELVQPIVACHAEHPQMFPVCSSDASQALMPRQAIDLDAGEPVQWLN